MKRSAATTVNTMEMKDYGKDSGVREDVQEWEGESPKKYDATRDRIDMDRLGKKQELKRNFRLISIFSFM